MQIRVGGTNEEGGGGKTITALKSKSVIRSKDVLVTGRLAWGRGGGCGVLRWGGGLNKNTTS